MISRFIPSAPQLPDSKWFGLRPARTHRMRKPFRYELQRGACGSHVIVVRLRNGSLRNGSLAKVPVDLKATCKQCLAMVEAGADLAEDSTLDCCIGHLMMAVLYGRPPSIESGFPEGRFYHHKHNE